MKEEISKLHAPPLIKSFIERRLHSLTGLFLVLFLFEHLLVNSQAALFVGDDGVGFIRAVNFIKTLPFLPVIELTLLGVPFFLHTYLGICYLFSSSPNSYGKNSARPVIKSSYNSAYTWQRITAILLVGGLLFHVTTMRFLKKPDEAKRRGITEYILPLSMDDGLYTLSSRLNVQLYGKKEIQEMRLQFEKRREQKIDLKNQETGIYNRELANAKGRRQEEQEEKAFLELIAKNTLSDTQVLAVTPYFGTAMLLLVRDTFKSTWMCVLYTLFVLAACFHALNGLWTFLITWGVVQSVRMQEKARLVSYALMMVILFLGLASVWGTYWINLKK